MGLGNQGSVISRDHFKSLEFFTMISCSCVMGLFTSTLFYIASICGIGVMYSLYCPKTSCTLNIFFITWTAILLLVMMVVSLHSKVCTEMYSVFCLCSMKQCLSSDFCFLSIYALQVFIWICRTGQQRSVVFRNNGFLHCFPLLVCYKKVRKSCTKTSNPLSAMLMTGKFLFCDV